MTISGNLTSRSYEAERARAGGHAPQLVGGKMAADTRVWPNYSKLGPGRHHCHLKKERPTYVAVWEERDGGVQVVEVIYAGTHEKAPY